VDVLMPMPTPTPTLMVIIVAAMRMMMTVFVSMLVIAATEEDGAHDIHDKAKRGDRNCLGEVNRHWPDKTRQRLVADEQRDHGEHDGAGKTGEIAELAGAEAEAVVVDVPARVAVGQRGEEKRAGMRRHMQSVGDERDRAEQQPADNLGDHHESAQRNHRPGAPLVARVAFAEKDVAVKVAVLVRHSSCAIADAARYLLEISLHRLDQLFGAAATLGITRRIDDMKADMVLDHLAH